MEKYSKPIRNRIVISALVLIVFGMLTACTTDSDPEDNSTMNAEEIRSFDISVPDEVLTDLNDRLVRTRLPDQIPGTGWDYGTNREYLKELIEYWKDEFDWRDQEEKLNGFDHFKTAIDGLDVHFIHERSQVDGAIPLILIHGWPGSFVEFVDID